MISVSYTPASNNPVIQTPQLQGGQGPSMPSVFHIFHADTSSQSHFEVYPEEISKLLATGR